ncbi:matrixin family metalloprotease [Hyphomicrobium sp. CS1GBMeth3]|uniref:matrixin family metalloprotease n=1 Tax=Hyphomicrobium sp. CS1GBMeth3 TaxID=1892845 RepID=UPI000AEA10F3|nr:matrixin family metalloprotease [Hyphomicrobium sp. CS1GBMeth3]
MRGLLPSVCVGLLVLISAPVDAPADEATSKQIAREFRLLELGGRKVRWSVPRGGLPATISYAFLTEPKQFPGARNCDAMLPPVAALQPSGIDFAAFRKEVRAAFAAWEKAANVVFRETTSVAAAGILIGADANARGRAFTNVALNETTRPSHNGLGAIRQSLICLNPQRPWKIGFDGNLDVYDVRFTVMHEIGHAIGLDHPSPEGQLMSYRYVEKAQGLQPGDIAGAVALYGRPGAAPAVENGAPSRAAAATPSGPLPRSRAFGIGEPLTIGKTR